MSGSWCIRTGIGSGTGPSRNSAPGSYRSSTEFSREARGRRSSSTDRRWRSRTTSSCDRSAPPTSRMHFGRVRSRPVRGTCWPIRSFHRARDSFGTSSPAVGSCGHCVPRLPTSCTAPTRSGIPHSFRRSPPVLAARRSCSGAATAAGVIRTETPRTGLRPMGPASCCIISRPMATSSGHTFHPNLARRANVGTPCARCLARVPPQDSFFFPLARITTRHRRISTRPSPPCRTLHSPIMSNDRRSRSLAGR